MNLYQCFLCHDIIDDEDWENYADYMIYCKKHKKFSGVGIKLSIAQQEINKIKNELGGLN